MTVAALVKALELEPHPEGGFYRQTYRSEAMREDGRHYATSILFLLTSENPSRFHRLDAEEIWYYHGGDPLIVHIIDELGAYKTIEIGPNLEVGQVFQAVVPPGVWFGSSVAPAKDGVVGWSLVGCAVAPGFTFDGFELADREVLLAHAPAQENIIARLTKVN